MAREMLAAAREATGGRAEISIHPDRIAMDATALHLRESGAERIFITLPAAPNGRADASLLAGLQRRLDRVARAHRLQRVPRRSWPGIIRFDYQRAGQQTEMVEIIVPQGGPVRSSVSVGKPRLAVIVDDLGNERASAETLLGLAVPLTFAILPQLPYSETIAEEARVRGFEVLLHLPIEPEDGQKAGPTELRPGMDATEVERTLVEMMDTVPNAVGVNNHEGSRGTADATLMNELMPLLAKRHLFFIDSRTTAATVAYEAAVRAGVPAASRSVFLDDTETPDAVRAQLLLAMNTARRNGSAIAIGHPHPETLKVLTAELPRLSQEGVSLVFASELCATGNTARPVQVSRVSPPPSWPPAVQLPAPK